MEIKWTNVQDLNTAFYVFFNYFFFKLKLYFKF